MDSVLRAALTYLMVWIVFRAAGKRTLSELTPFDFVLLLIVTETVEAALVGADHSFTNTFLLITTLIGIDVALSLWKQRSSRIEKLIDGVPLILLADGLPIAERMTKARVDEADILAAARKLRGLERLEQIKYAVLECNGGITIIPKGPPAP